MYKCNEIPINHEVHIDSRFDYTLRSVQKYFQEKDFPETQSFYVDQTNERNRKTHFERPLDKIIAPKFFTE